MFYMTPQLDGAKILCGRCNVTRADSLTWAYVAGATSPALAGAGLTDRVQKCMP